MVDLTLPFFFFFRRSGTLLVGANAKYLDDVESFNGKKKNHDGVVEFQTQNSVKSGKSAVSTIDHLAGQSSSCVRSKLDVVLCSDWQVRSFYNSF